jgi:hypothetical protein
LRSTPRQKKIKKNSSTPEKLYEDNGVTVLYEDTDITINTFTAFVAEYYSASVTYPNKGQAMAILAPGIKLNYWAISGAIGLTGNYHRRLPHAQFVMNWQDSRTETTAHSINEATESEDEGEINTSAPTPTTNTQNPNILSTPKRNRIKLETHRDNTPSKTKSSTTPKKRHSKTNTSTKIDAPTLPSLLPPPASPNPKLQVTPSPVHTKNTNTPLRSRRMPFTPKKLKDDAKEPAKKTPKRDKNLEPEEDYAALALTAPPDSATSMDSSAEQATTAPGSPASTSEEAYALPMITGTLTTRAHLIFAKDLNATLKNHSEPKWILRRTLVPAILAHIVDQIHANDEFSDVHEWTTTYLNKHHKYFNKAEINWFTSHAVRWTAELSQLHESNTFYNSQLNCQATLQRVNSITLVSPTEVDSDEMKDRGKLVARSDQLEASVALLQRQVDAGHKAILFAWSPNMFIPKKAATVAENTKLATNAKNLATINAKGMVVITAKSNATAMDFVDFKAGVLKDTNNAKRLMLNMGDTIAENTSDVRECIGMAEAQGLSITSNQEQGEKNQAELTALAENMAEVRHGIERLERLVERQEE